MAKYLLDGEFFAEWEDGINSLAEFAEVDVSRLEEVVEVVVPETVTRAQGKAALIQAGYWQDVLDFVEAISDPTQKLLAQVALNDTTEWKRDSPFLKSAATSLGLSEEQLDTLFIAASSIEL